MMIRIRHLDGRFDMVKAARLDDFIKLQKISGFRRSSGWVVLGKDFVRGLGNPASYAGPDRRCDARQSSTETVAGNRLAALASRTF